MEKKIHTCENPKFLGIRFDRHLTFTNQIEYLKDACVNRLNIIKILSHKSWHLSKTTLVQIYNTLIRSIIEYSAILRPMISNTNLNQLQIIQNNAIRIIFKQKIDTKICDLHKMANIKPITDRLDELRGRYVRGALCVNNPMIATLKDEYLSFKQGRLNDKKNTFFKFILISDKHFFSLSFFSKINVKKINNNYNFLISI